MAVANNADDYANARLNIFFPGVTPDLDGQCVSLVKWFMAEMSQVPNPQAARGDARYVGQTLVNQGHATEVEWASRKRGDIVCYEYGTYGHIGVYLSGNRVFEENVNMPGTTKKLVDGAYVYSSRIGAESESWRTGKNPHIYRLKTYVEGGGMEPSSEDDVNNIYLRLLRRMPESGAAGPRIGKSFRTNFYEVGDSAEGTSVNKQLTMNTDDLNNLMGELGVPTPANPNDIEFHLNQHHGIWNQSFYDLIKRPDRIRIPDLQKEIADLKKQLAEAGSGGVDPETKAKIDEINTTTKSTNEMVKYNKDLLTRVFK